MYNVRAIVQDDEPWFVAKDICEILEIGNPTDAVKRLDEDEVARFDLGGLSGQTNIISESGLFSLVMGSRKAEAKAFKKWVTSVHSPKLPLKPFWKGLKR